MFAIALENCVAYWFLADADVAPLGTTLGEPSLFIK